MPFSIRYYCPIVQTDQNSHFYLYALSLFAGSTTLLFVVLSVVILALIALFPLLLLLLSCSYLLPCPLEAAHEELESCDLCLVVGTSSVVYPAAMFAPQVKRATQPFLEIFLFCYFHVTVSRENTILKKNIFYFLFLKASCYVKPVGWFVCLCSATDNVPYLSIANYFARSSTAYCKIQRSTILLCC